MSIPIYKPSEINFSEALNAEIEKVQQLLNLLGAVKDLDEADMYLTTNDVANLLKCSIREAQNYMNREGFPKLEVGKSAKVNKIAFLLYNLERRTK